MFIMFMKFIMNILIFQSLANTLIKTMPKEKRPISSDDSDSGPEDRAPLPKSQKKSLHKVSHTYLILLNCIKCYRRYFAQ